MFYLRVGEAWVFGFKHKALFCDIYVMPNLLKYLNVTEPLKQQLC